MNVTGRPTISSGKRTKLRIENHVKTGKSDLVMKVTGESFPSNGVTGKIEILGNRIGRLFFPYFDHSVACGFGEFL